MQRKLKISIISLASLLVLLLGVKAISAKFESIESTAEESAAEISSEVEETNIEEEDAVSEDIEFDSRPADIPLPQMDYAHYAKPDDRGFAYQIQSDPDISSEIYPITDSSEKILLLTFDDAPRVPDSYALGIAERLKEKGVGAIFLVNGMYLDNPEGVEIIKQIHEMGFEIGNHTETHENLTELSYEEQRWEIETTHHKIEEITGVPVRWFRPPFGQYNMDTLHILNDLNVQLMNWTFGYDWMEEYHDGEALAQVSLETDFLHGGANILMHDLPWTLDAIDKMVDGYLEMGYYIVDPLLIEHQQNNLD